MLNVKRHYSGQSSRRSHTRVYYVSNCAVSTRVCKVAFLRIHGISNGRLDQTIRAQGKNSGSPSNDMRGRHTPTNKTSKTDVDLVKEHILSFPQHQSHYSRADNPHRKYLSPELSITKMYFLYKEWCTEKGVAAVSEWMYREVFNTRFNFRLEGD